MTCLCRTEFCYLCRARWKTCACPQWDEHRLLAVAEQRVDARLGVGQHRWERRRPVPPAQPAWLARPAQPPPVVPVVQARAQPVPPVPPPRPAPRPRTPTPPPVVRLRPPQLVQNRVQPTPGPSQPAAVPTWRQRLVEARARSLGAAAATATAPTAAVRAQPQAQRQTTPATNSHAVRSPQLPTTTHAGVSGARPTALTVPPKPAALTGSARASTVSTQAGPSTSKPQTQAQTSPRTSATATTATMPRATAAIKSIVSNLNERQRNNQQGETQGGSGSGPNLRRIGTQNDAVRQGMIREMMEQLRVDHECDHNKWRYRHGGGRCESCHHELPMYLFVSGLFVCWRVDRG